MLKIKRTKVPTCKQLTCMTLNLAEKSNSHAKLSFEVNIYKHAPGRIFYNFWFHSGNGDCFDIRSWEKLQDKYFEIINAKE